MSRQTSDRLVPISSAILVPLTTTVAWSLNRRTMRPRRWSVACDDFLRRLCCATRTAGLDVLLAMGNYPPTCGYSQQNSMVRKTHKVLPLGLTPSVGMTEQVVRRQL